MKKFVRSRAPLRLGLAGGGTDVSPYCDQFTGYVLNATIDRYAYCVLEPCDNDNVYFIATDHGIATEVACADFPFTLDGQLNLHKAVYNRMIDTFHESKPLSLRLTTFCDAPVGSGLGASSTLVVAMIKSFDELWGLGLDDYHIAHLAYDIERQDCGIQGGKQDQYSATFGGINFMEFYDNNKVLVNPLRVRNWIVCELESSLLLYYTGKSRMSSKIISEQSNNIAAGKEKPLESMHQLKASALTMKEALLRGDFDTFVEGLNTSWQHKKQSAEAISNPQIEEAFQVATDTGAMGGKVSGAGGGGFIMFFVSPEHRKKVIDVLTKKGGWVSNCHFSHEGSQSWTLKA